jgi:hypothetical protein
VNPRALLTSWRAALRQHPSWLAAAGAACLFVALVGWAVASPVSATPDEDYHLASIWCSHGTRPGLCEPGDQPDSRRVPREILLDRCFSGQSEKSATCQWQITDGQQLVDTTRGNFHDGMYPPVFYWFLGFFVTGDVTNSVLIMRIVNALLFVALVGAIYVLTPPGLRRSVVVAGLVTAVPVSVFLVPSINPSSWAILSAMTLLVSVLGYVLAKDRRRRIGMAVLAAVALVVGAGARADAAIYAAVACVAAVVLVSRRDRVAMRRLAYPALLLIGALGVFLSTGQSTVASGGHAAEPFSLSRIARAIMDVPALWTGSVGSPPPKPDFGPGWPWGLGWGDTGMPGSVWAGMWGLYVAILFVALAGRNRRQLLAVAVVGAAALMIPAYVVGTSALGEAVTVAGSKSPLAGVQPRYVLPLLVLAAIVATLRLEGDAFRLTRGHRWVLVGIVSVANAIALHTNLRRWISGVDVAGGWNLDPSSGWWWSASPISPFALWAIVSLVFAVGAALLTVELTKRADAIDTTSGSWLTIAKVADPVAV